MNLISTLGYGYNIWKIYSPKCWWLFNCKQKKYWYNVPLLPAPTIVPFILDHIVNISKLNISFLPRGIIFQWHNDIWILFWPIICCQLLPREKSRINIPFFTHLSLLMFHFVVFYTSPNSHINFSLVFLFYWWSLDIWIFTENNSSWVYILRLLMEQLDHFHFENMDFLYQQLLRSLASIPSNRMLG